MLNSPLQFKLNLAGLAAASFISGAALSFVCNHPGLWSTAIAGVSCGCTAIFAGWIVRFEDVSQKGTQNSASHPAEPPAATGLDQVIAVLGKKPYEELSRLGDKILEDHR